MEALTASNRVTALFRDATLLAFDLGPETSLGALAEQIGEAARPHGGLSLPVLVKLAAEMPLNKALGREPKHGRVNPLAEKAHRARYRAP